MVSTETADLDAEINVPQEYITDIINLVMNQLRTRKATPQDSTNDGLDKV